MTLSSAVEGIKVDDAVTGTGISGIVTVAAISGTALTLSSAQTIASGVNLTIATHITTFAVAENAPENLYYYCPNHIKMGGDIIVLTS